MRILCAVLLVFLGFAHKPVAAVIDTPAEIASYVLPDGSISSLCQPGEDGKPGKHVDRGCDACRLTAGTILATPDDTGGVILRRTAEVAFVAPAERFHRLNFPPSAPPRGPPAIPVSFATA